MLREAEAGYQEGRIADVYPVRAACLEKKATRAERIRAWSVLAKAYVADDEIEQARAAVKELIGLAPEFTPAPQDPYLFGDLVETTKDALTVARVATVSKVDEPLREAPATVIVVTAEEIERRGYLDLEEVLHDLPGFDISRGNGDVYSNVYMRGYRSDRSDRMLFLVDGVEQNDLHSNTAFISRQYPLSNIAQIEVVYGPASTIYGANAFTGVVSVTTKQPEALIAEGENLGFSVTAGGGSFQTGFVDATIAGRTPSGRLSWSLTGRSFRSDEQDLSVFDEWDYDFSELEDLDYQEAMRIEGPLAGSLAEFCELLPEDCQVVTEGGRVVAIEPTPAGAEKARLFDRALFEELQGRSFEFSDQTDDWAIDGKLKIQNFTFGLQMWRRKEGTTPWYDELLRTGSESGNVSIPAQTNIFARYTQRLGGDVSLSLFSRFKQHELDRGSSVARLLTYAGGSMNIVELAALGLEASFQRMTFDQSSSQFRNELTIVYQPSRRFHLVGGVELRTSSVQVELTSAVEEQIPSFAANPIFDFPFFETQVTGSSTDTTSVGIFAQASWKPREDFKIVVGGRLDTSSVSDDTVFVTFDIFPTADPSFEECMLLGLGSPPCDLRTSSFVTEGSETVFNPRLALVYSRGDWVAKAIYSEAFKAPSNFQRFTREPGVRDFSSDDFDLGVPSDSQLESEAVRNLEGNVTWQPRDDLSVELAAYEATYSNAVGLIQQTGPDPLFIFPSVSGRFRNIGGLRIRGAQVHARWRYRDFDFFGNYTYTDPVNVDPIDELGNPDPSVDERRVGDIASHRLNLGFDLALGDKWDLGLRTNWVGDRPTGSDTTVRDNPFDEIDSYFVANAALSYEGFPAAGAKWQLVVRNLFDSDYFHPGVQRSGAGFAARLPQPGRAIYLRLLYKR